LTVRSLSFFVVVVIRPQGLDLCKVSTLARANRLVVIQNRPRLPLSAVAALITGPQHQTAGPVAMTGVLASCVSARVPAREAVWPRYLVRLASLNRHQHCIFGAIRAGTRGVAFSISGKTGPNLTVSPTPAAARLHPQAHRDPPMHRGLAVAPSAAPFH